MNFRLLLGMIMLMNAPLFACQVQVKSPLEQTMEEFEKQVQSITDLTQLKDVGNIIAQVKITAKNQGHLDAETDKKMGKILSHVFDRMKVLKQNSETKIAAEHTQTVTAATNTVQKTVTDDLQDTQTEQRKAYRLLDTNSFLDEMSKEAKTFLEKNFDTLDFTKTLAIESRKTTYLMQAAHDGRTDIIEKILKKCPKILEAQDKYLDTALHYAISNKKKSSILTLLQNGANLESRNDKGQTPLILAVEYNDPEIVELLMAPGAKIKKLRGIGANINAQDNEGGTALHYAVRNNNPAMVEILLNYKADFLIENSEGIDPITLAENALDDRVLIRHSEKQTEVEMENLNGQIISILHHYEKGPARAQRIAEKKKQEERKQRALKHKKNIAKKEARAAQEKIAQAQEQKARAEQEERERQKQAYIEKERATKQALKTARKQRDRELMAQAKTHLRAKLEKKYFPLLRDAYTKSAAQTAANTAKADQNAQALLAKRALTALQQQHQKIENMEIIADNFQEYCIRKNHAQLFKAWQKAANTDYHRALAGNADRAHNTRIMAQLFGQWKHKTEVGKVGKALEDAIK